MVLNIDLAPTFLDLAGLPVPAQMQGRSWRPLLTGQPADWRKSFLAEYFAENAFPNTPTLVALRTADAKLVKYPGHAEWTELFDLARDPYETKNLAADPAHKDLLARMQAEFDAQSKLTQYQRPRLRRQTGRQRPARRQEGRQEKEETVRQPRVNRSRIGFTPEPASGKSAVDERKRFISRKDRLPYHPIRGDRQTCLITCSAGLVHA